MSEHSLPEGRTRISEAVVDTISMTAAREVRGVMDIVGIAKGAVVGAAVGVVVGSVGAGVGGAVIGASAGTAAGAAAAHLLAREHQRLAREQRRRSFHDMHQEVPSIRLHLSAEYGADLRQLAEDVREQVRASIREVAGLEVQTIEVVFTEVVPPHKPSRNRFSSDEP